METSLKGTSDQWPHICWFKSPRFLHAKAFPITPLQQILFLSFIYIYVISLGVLLAYL